MEKNKGLDYTNKLILMGKCGGLCEFKGCNKILVKEYLTATESNISNFTHIIAKSEKRLRENKKLSSILSNAHGNIMALCSEHHILIDKYPNVYTIECLRNMKYEHEKYIEDL